MLGLQCLPAYPLGHTFELCFGGLTLQLGVSAHHSGINSGYLNHLPIRVQVIEPFVPGLPGAPVPNSVLQAPNRTSPPRRDRLLAPSCPSPAMGWAGSVVTKSLPSPSGPKNPPLLSLTYPEVQRASQEAKLDCWPWPSFPHP